MQKRASHAYRHEDNTVTWVSCWIGLKLLSGVNKLNLEAVEALIVPATVHA